MEKLRLSADISYDSFIEMGKDVYRYPGRFYVFFSSQAFLKALSEDKKRYGQYLRLKSAAPIPDVFLFRMSYILNPYMSLRYHRFIFSDYADLGRTILSYGPDVDVYLKDLLIYHLLSEYMVRLGDDQRFATAYKTVLEKEKEAVYDENGAYWELGFELAQTKTLIYRRESFESPEDFFARKTAMADIIPFASSFLSDRCVLTWLKLKGYQHKLDRFYALSHLTEEKEEAASLALAQRLYDAFAPEARIK